VFPKNDFLILSREGPGVLGRGAAGFGNGGKGGSGSGFGRYFLLIPDLTAESAIPICKADERRLHELGPATEFNRVGDSEIYFYAS
jgi:hypothetical protein